MSLGVITTEAGFYVEDNKCRSSTYNSSSSKFIKFVLLSSAWCVSYGNTVIVSIAISVGHYEGQTWSIIVIDEGLG